MKWVLFPLWLHLRIDQKTHKNSAICINEEGMYEFLFSSQQLKAKQIRKHCCNVMLPHVRQQLTNKMKENHQQAIEENDNQIQAIQCENVALQEQKEVYQVQLQRCQDQMAKSTTLLSNMLLVQMIPVKVTLWWLLRKTPPPMKMSFMSIPTLLREYNDCLLAQKLNTFKVWSLNFHYTQNLRWLYFSRVFEMKLTRLVF